MKKHVYHRSGQDDADASVKNLFKNNYEDLLVQARSEYLQAWNAENCYSRRACLKEKPESYDILSCLKQGRMQNLEGDIKETLNKYQNHHYSLHTWVDLETEIKSGLDQYSIQKKGRCRTLGKKKGITGIHAIYYVSVAKLAQYIIES